MTQLCLGPWKYSDSSLDCHWHFEYFRDDFFSFLTDFSYFPQNYLFSKVTEHDQNRSKIYLLKDVFNYFSIDCQLFYFLTRIIPTSSKKNNKFCPCIKSSSPVFTGVCVTRSLILFVCFVDRCLSFYAFSFGRSFDYTIVIFKLFLYFTWSKSSKLKIPHLL